MGRAVIITSGGYNCENSSVMVGATVAFLLLPKMCDDSSRLLSTALILLCAGFVASFSMAIGLAIWPTLLVLAWCLRLPRHLMVMLAVAGLAAAIIFVLLPPSPYDLSPLQGIHWRGPSAVYTTIVWLCRLIGSPVSYTVFAWWPDKSFHHLIESSGLALWSGAGGLVLAATAALPQLSQHKIRKSTLQLQDLLWLFFNIFGLLLVIGGRSSDFPPSMAAMSLVNETKGEQMTKVLFRDPSQIYHVAPQLRARRLDMFTDGLQDWIGLSETNLFGGRHKPERLTGDCSVTALVQGDDGLEAARVIGQASTKENSIPERLVIVDPTGVVRGVARSSTMSSIINRVFYLGKFSQFSRNPRCSQ